MSTSLADCRHDPSGQAGQAWKKHISGFLHRLQHTEGKQIVGSNHHLMYCDAPLLELVSKDGKGCVHVKHFHLT